MNVLTASELSTLVNAYSVSEEPPKQIQIPHASALAALQEVTVSGVLLPKQAIHLDLQTGARSLRTGPQQGAYTRQEQDGDLHFCLGPNPGEPHITCELQHAAPWIPLFNAAIRQVITVSGYFRCLFEHPGFRGNDDAHLFEIHPVRAVRLNESLYSFDVDSPDPDSVHTWASPHDLNEQDGQIQVVYEAASDTLTFTDMNGQDENYITVSGTISNVQLNERTDALASFTLSSHDFPTAKQVYCLKGTSAALQLGQLQVAGTTAISLIGLRNIDLTEALQNHYVVNLLAINISEA